MKMYAQRVYITFWIPQRVVFYGSFGGESLAYLDCSGVYITRHVLLLRSQKEKSASPVHGSTTLVVRVGEPNHVVSI